MKQLHYSVMLILCVTTIARAQLVQTPAHIINNLQRTTRVWGSNSHTLGKTSQCPTDTVNYAFNKTTQLNAISLNNSTSGNTFAQWYPAAQAITVSGFEFYAWQSAGLGSTVAVVCKIYNASMIDSLPTGTALATVTVNVDSSFGTGQLTTLRRKAVFSSPVTVTGAYVLTVENQSATNVSVITDSWSATVPDGKREWLSSVKIGANFIRGYNVNVGGAIFDADFLIQPFVKYTLAANFIMPSACNQGGNMLTFTNTSSSVLSSKFYNTYAFFGIPQYCSMWDYGDSSGINYSVTGSKSYFYRSPHLVTLRDTIYGWTTGCGDSYSQNVNAAPRTPVASNNGPFCLGSTMRLFADTIPGATYFWTGPNGFTSSAQNPVLAGINATAQGTYSVRALMAQCSSFVATTIVNVISSPSALSNGPLCAGQTLTLSATTITGASYSWTGPNGFSSTQQTPNKSNIQVSDSGTYSVTINSSGCGVIGPYSVYVSVNPVPATPTAGNNGPLCVGDNLNLSTPNYPGASYSWTGPNGFSSSQQNPSRPSVINSFAGTYSVTISAGGCASQPGSSTVTINNIPAAPVAGNNGPLCAGQTLSLTATTVANASYTWSGPNSFSSTGQNPTRSAISLIDAGTYSVIARVNGCASPAATTSVAITSATPTPVATSNGPLCPGQDLLLGASNIAGATYSWTGPNGFSSSLQNPVLANIDNSNSGIYSVTATTTGCGLSQPGTVTLVVNALPQAPAISSNSPLCEGQSLSLTATTITGATYAWSGPNGFSSSQQSPVISNMNGTRAGDYSVYVNVPGCGTSPTSTSSIIVRRVPSAPTALSNSPVCSGDTLHLTGLSSGTGPGAVFSWSGPNGFSSSLTKPELGNSSAAIHAGTYTLTVTDSGCTSNAGTVNVTVKSLPLAPIATNTGPLCEGDNLFLSASTVSGATYSWTGPGGFLSTAQNPILASAAATGTGTYYVSSVVAGCVSPAASTTVLIKARPATPVAGNNGPKCTGDNVSLSGGFAQNATYSWSGPNNFLSSQQNPVLSSVTTAMAGTYSLLTTVQGCVSFPGTTEVIINPVPAAPVLSSVPANTACGGDSLQLFAVFVSGATYEWTGPAGYGASVQNPVLHNIGTLNSGQYSATLTKNGCLSPAASLALTVNAAPLTGDISGADTVKNNQTSTYTLSGEVGSVFNWIVLGGSIQSGGNTNTIEVLWGAAGAGMVRGRETGVSGCRGPLRQLNVTVLSTTAIEEVRNGFSSSIYPNPAHKEVNIALNLLRKNEVSIVLYDMLGREAMRRGLGTISGISSSTLALDGLQAGVYFVKISAGNESATYKLTVQ